MKPWEKYQEAQVAEEIPGPWQNYQAAEPSLAWSEVGRQALQNLPASARQLGQDIIYPFQHPVETAEALGNLSLGAAQKLWPGEQEQEKYADAFGQFFADRYGGMENLKRTMAEDPAGFLADAATVFSGGAAAMARTPLAATKVGRAVQTVAHPLRAAGAGAAELVGNLGTHTGGRTLRLAAGAGRAGGEKGRAFRQAMTGTAPMEDVVSDARRALGEIRKRRNAAYRQGMRQLGQETAILRFTPIDDAMKKAADVKRYKGVDISRKTAGIRDEIQGLIDEWKALDPAEYHTAEGLDALKQAIGDIRDSTDFNTPSRVVADQAYNAVKDAIVKQAPDYATTMRGYWQGTELIKDMEKTLSLNPKASVDTQLRKLQSVMRDNAYTNYGRRVALAEMLVDAGAENLMEKLAGQSLGSLAPRGLGRAVAGAAGVGGVALDPALLATLPLQSPRLMGEAAYGLGAASRLAPPAGTLPAIYQTGRASREYERSR